MERVEFISVPVCHGSSCPIRDLKGLSLSKLDSKTFPSYSSSALCASVPGYYLSIIWIVFFIIQITKIPLFQRSVV